MSVTSTLNFNSIKKFTKIIGISPSSIVSSISPMHNKRLAHIAGQILKYKLRYSIYYISKFIFKSFKRVYANHNIKERSKSQ